MDINNSQPKTATITGAGADQLIKVPAAELLGWARLATELADWLIHAEAATRADYSRFYDGFRTTDTTARSLVLTSQRITTLLDDQDQP